MAWTTINPLLLVPAALPSSQGCSAVGRVFGKNGWQGGRRGRRGVAQKIPARDKRKKIPARDNAEDSLRKGHLRATKAILQAAAAAAAQRGRGRGRHLQQASQQLEVAEQGGGRGNPPFVANGPKPRSSNCKLALPLSAVLLTQRVMGAPQQLIPLLQPIQFQSGTVGGLSKLEWAGCYQGCQLGDIQLFQESVAEPFRFLVH